MRCKFRLDSIERSHTSIPVYKPDGMFSHNEPGEVQTLTFNPIYSSDKTTEDGRFFASTPSGQFRVSCVNATAVSDLVLGASYYLDIIPANGESK